MLGAGEGDRASPRTKEADCERSLTSAVRLTTFFTNPKEPLLGHRTVGHPPGRPTAGTALQACGDAGSSGAAAAASRHAPAAPVRRARRRERRAPRPHLGARRRWKDGAPLDLARRAAAQDASAWMSLRPRRGESAFWARVPRRPPRASLPATRLAWLASRAPRAGTPAGFVDRLLNAVARAAVSGDARHRRLPQPSPHRGRQRDRAAPAGRDPEAAADHLHAPRSRPARPRLPGERGAGRASCRRSRLHRGRDARVSRRARRSSSNRRLFQVLLDRTEGWAAGLRLFTLSLRGVGDRSTPCSTTAPPWTTSCRRRLRSQPEETRRFLLQTSIVDRLTPELAEALTGMESAGMLEDLVNQNLFIERVGSRPAWYRYHHLFAEILRTELLQDAPAEVQELHARAAALVPRQGGEPRRRPARIRGRRSRACVVVPRRVVVRPPESRRI